MKILVFGITENPGGVESVIMNYYRHIDRSRFHFDFLCNTETVAYEEEIKSLGGTIYRIPARSKNIKAYKKAMDEFFSEYAADYSAIWVNVCSLANIDYLIYAKKYGIKHRIIHSHNSQNMDSRSRGLLHRINRLRLNNYATDYWACTHSAAEWFYDQNTLNKVVYIRNAINIQKYEFNEQARVYLRDHYGLGEKFVIGNIGRLHFQKNQSFAIDIFDCYHKMDPESVLVLIGQGEDRQKLEEKAEKLNLKDSVLFTGIQDNIPAWLSAFDFFLLPSVFEGLPLAGLEAQASGLISLASEKVIPERLKVNGNWHFFSLKKTAQEWADEIVKLKKTEQREPFSSVQRSMIAAGYDILSEAAVLSSLFVGMAK